jgi:hypothetical protein
MYHESLVGYTQDKAAVFVPLDHDVILLESEHVGTTMREGAKMTPYHRRCMELSVPSLPQTASTSLVPEDVWRWSLEAFGSNEAVGRPHPVPRRKRESLSGRLN